MEVWDKVWNQVIPQREITRRINEKFELFRDSFELSEAFIEKVFAHIDHVWGHDVILKECGVRMKYKVYHDHVPEDMHGTAAWVQANKLFLNGVLLSKLFQTEQFYYVGGIQLCDLFSVVMHVLLHEYVHVFLYYARRFKVYDWRESHGPEFMKRVGQWYGHTDFQHSLIPGFQENRMMRSVQTGNKVKVFVDKNHYVVGHVVNMNGDMLSIKGEMCPPDRTINGVHAHVGRVIAIIS